MMQAWVGKDKVRLPPINVMRALRTEALHLTLPFDCLPEDRWRRWGSMTLSFREHSPECTALAQAQPVLSEDQVRRLVHLAIHTVLRTGGIINIRNMRLMRSMADDYRDAAAGGDWSRRELLGWIERFTRLLCFAAHRDHDDWLRRKGVPEHSVANRSYDILLAYADMHVAMWMIDRLEAGEGETPHEETNAT